MLVATLLTAPSHPSLDSALVDSLRNAWGGGDVQWLSVDEAAEFAFENQPENQWEVWAELQKMGVDLNIQALQHRKKKMLLADMDSTMIQQECIDELAAEASVGDQVSDITARAMNGELDFEEALKERVALLAGLDAGVVGHVLSSRITYMPGGATLVATMKSDGAYCALVSGGFTSFTTKVANDLGFDEHRANTLHIENGRLAGTVGLPILGKQAKVEALQSICERLNISETEVMAVGDGANDLGMLQRAGAGVALHAKPSVAAQCNIRINYGDLTALLYLQGIAKSDFSPA